MKITALFTSKSVLAILALTLASCRTSPPSTPSISLSTSTTTVTAPGLVQLVPTLQNFVPTQVEFFEGSTSLGIDNTQPFGLSREITGPEVASRAFRVTATNAQGATVTSSVVLLAINIPEILLIYPNPATVLAGAAPISFEAQRETLSVRESASVTWTLNGPGTLSATEGTNVNYTPPATIESETTATVTVSKSGVPEATGVITIKPNVSAGNTYLVEGRIFNSSAGNTRADIYVSDSSGATFPSALVTANGDPVLFAGGRFQGMLSSRIADSGLVNLVVTVPEGDISTTISLPESPVLTSPVGGSTISAGEITLEWAQTESPYSFRGGLSPTPYDSTLAKSLSAAGDRRSAVITSVQPATSFSAYLFAQNYTTAFSGPFKAGSNLWAENISASSSVAFQTAP